MPDAIPSAGGAGQPPQAAAGASQGQPQFGSSPVTGATQNRGFEAAGLQRLGMAVKILEECIPLLGAASPPGTDVLDAVKRLSKHVPPGMVSPAAQRNTMQQMMMRQAQAAPQMAALRAAMAGGGGAGGAPGAGGGAGAMPPGAGAAAAA